jgi:hypothetical protein
MALILALALAVAKADPAHPAWMIGTWGWQNTGELSGDCGSDHSTTYHRNGTYDFVDTTGTWRIDGDKLIETQTDPGGSGDPADNGKPRIIKFQRLGPGVLRVAGEFPGNLIKCPAG